MAVLGSASTASLGYVGLAEMPSKHIAFRFPDSSSAEKFCYVHGGGEVECKSEKIAAHEMFQIVKHYDEPTVFRLKSDHTQKFCNDYGEDGIKCDQDEGGENALFEIDTVGSEGNHGLRAVGAQKWCMNTGDKIVCTSDNKVGWCRWTLLMTPLSSPPLLVSTLEHEL